MDDEPEAVELLEFNLKKAGYDVTTAADGAQALKQARSALTHTEFKLLVILAQRRGRVQSREQLLREVWDYNSMIDTRTVDTHMRRLRKKLGPAAKHLDTVRGVGYRFVETPS